MTSLQQPFVSGVVELSATPTDMDEVPDAVPPIHAVSSHVATDKDPSK